MGNKQEKNKNPKLDDKNITSGKIKDFNTNDSRNNSKRDILKNIKSKYIMIIVLSNLNEKIKLDIFKYNKRIQNIININLNNYKFFSGRYIEYETNEEGKEYNVYNDKLIFEGKYLNGERNGKGKEYNNDKLIFEGKYKNGKRYGKGKEYDYIGDLIFNSEYLYNHRIKGREYISSILEFEGEYLYDKKYNGKGYDKNGSISYVLINGNWKIKEYDFKGSQRLKENI